jgi:hypothetical protein
MPGRYWPVSVVSTSGSARLKVLAHDHAGTMNCGVTSSTRTSAKCVRLPSHAIAAPAASSSTMA